MYKKCISTTSGRSSPLVRISSNPYLFNFTFLSLSGDLSRSLDTILMTEKGRKTSITNSDLVQRFNLSSQIKNCCVEASFTTTSKA